MSDSQRTSLKIVFGAMTFGKPGESDLLLLAVL